MNITLLHMGFACALGLLLVACGGGTSSRAGQNETNDGGSCSISAGNYVEHFTAEAGTTRCPPIPDETLTLGGSETISGGTAGAADGGPGCTVDVDTASCTITTHCTNVDSGLSTELSSTFTFGSSPWSGKETMRMTDSTGRVLSNCTYDVAITKK
jgi:hypothetical protein